MDQFDSGYRLPLRRSFGGMQEMHIELISRPLCDSLFCLFFSVALGRYVCLLLQHLRLVLVLEATALVLTCLRVTGSYAKHHLTTRTSSTLEKIARRPVLILIHG